MSKARKIFWIIFGVYFLVAQISTLVADYYQNDLGFLINMKGYIPLMKFFALTGLIMYFIAFFMLRVSTKSKSKDIKYLELEKRELKVKMFDLQEELKSLKEKSEQSVDVTNPDPETTSEG